MPKPIGLSIADWPAADRAAWDRAFDERDFFDTEAVAAQWGPITRQQAAYAHGRFLAHLLANDPIAMTLPVGERATPDRLRHYSEGLSRRIKPMSVAAELQHLMLALTALAPRQDWRWLRAQQYAVQKHARPRDHRLKMVHPLRLVALGKALMDSADQEPRVGERARRYRDGLVIALLAHRPLRRRSLSCLAIGVTLHKVGGGYSIALGEDATKSGTPVEFGLLPTELVPYLDRYLEHYRPLFPNAATSTALWLSSKGGALGAQALYALICRRTKEAFGFAVHPHLFREIAASTIAREAPDRVAIARDLLTHAKFDTTDRHYIQARTVEAGRVHAATVAKLRETTS